MTRMRGRPRIEDESERFMRHVVVENSGCWRWTGYILNGVPRYNARALNPTGFKAQPARASALEIFGSPPPKKSTITAKCGRPDCVNPAHCAVKVRRVVKPPKPRLTLAQRFWAKVYRTSECWEWKGVRNNCGYGRLHVGTRDGRKLVLAHRVSFEIHCGPIPDGMVIMHRCDNPACVRPDHLLLGTVEDNIRDAADKRYRRRMLA